MDELEENTKSKCEDKMSFDTHREAVTAATVARFQHQGQRLKAYRCRECGLWHLASAWENKA